MNKLSNTWENQFQTLSCMKSSRDIRVGSGPVMKSTGRAGNCGRSSAQGRAGRVCIVRVRVSPGNLLNNSPRAWAGRVGRNTRGGPRGASKNDAPHTSVSDREKLRNSNEY